ncbi:hypothetical protein K431DRAFT_283885 [Polychaeton citri CBS 116435]|uniref:CRAL-TRIO domain-containing protein n=1 Tax=Polychaeton citri CBS 116435 TaxID=1314669 RepID=A0A9P4QD38_9PEZI|nr:hypothetical protein K431DRAFT_283885 [Polychaeton citri CBS 116435]
MRSALAAVAEKRADIRQKRQRSHSLTAVPPATTSDDYLHELAQIAASILYRSPRLSNNGLPIYVLNAAAFPDAWEVDYDSLLPYVLARLPGEDELLSGQEYEVVFFAGGQPDSATSEKKQGPGIGWYLQAYHVLSRATRKKLQKLYIVHPRTWVRVLIGVFGTIVSPKFRRKIFTINTLTGLAQHVRIEQLLIPPAVYLHDRKLSQDIHTDASGKRAYGVRHPLPKNLETGHTRLPRVLRETTSFIIQPGNIGTEGIFRIPPHSILAGVLREAYDRGQEWIVWREPGTIVVQPPLDSLLLEEIRPEDTYGVHLAASLIKSWYRELQEPIFPEAGYSILRERYGGTARKVAPEDLVDLLLPASDRSPLSTTSREILTRHLLPLLSMVAAKEPQNKMTPEALSICFAMALLCGSNQLEDAKMTNVIKRILIAAIEAWPQLSHGMGIDGQMFEHDLQSPENPNDYEDPLEQTKSRLTSQGEKTAAEKHLSDYEPHRIVLVDDLDGNEGKPPPLPPRRSRAPSATNGHQQQQPPPIDTTLGAMPKRKPAPAAVAPPRYSSIFDVDGNSIHVADSPASYAPADGFGPRRRGDWSIDSDHKKVPPPHLVTPTEIPQALEMPKRKAVSSETSPESTSAPISRAVSSDAALMSAARAAAQTAAAGMAQKLVESPVITSPATFGSNTSDTNFMSAAPDSAVSDSVTFRKPSWPASAVRASSHPISTLNSQTYNTVPVIRQTPAVKSDAAPPPVSAKPRAPSPGLLKRMATMGPTPSAPMAGTDRDSTTARLQPRPLNTKRTSVDDLRRLYEERASTAESLKVAAQIRRGSSLV